MTRQTKPEAPARRFVVVPDDSVTITLAVKRRLLMDLLCTAVEGGFGDWSHYYDAERTPDLDYLSVRVAEIDEETGKQISNRRVRYEDLRIGLERLSVAEFPSAGKHLADALSEEGDAITADVVMQMTILGDLIYG